MTWKGKMYASQFSFATHFFLQIRYLTQFLSVISDVVRVFVEVQPHYIRNFRISEPGALNKKMFAMGVKKLITNYL